MRRPTGKGKRFGELPSWQPSLFLDPALAQVPPFDPFPVVHHTYEGFLKVLREAEEGLLGLDFEFRTLASGKYVPTVIGIANTRESAALKYSNEACQAMLDSGLSFVGHSFLGAERKVIKDALGYDLPLSRIEDSMRAQYWAHLSWSKAPDKNVDTDEQGSGGFMDLFSATSWHTDLPQWKIHRGGCCQGPCPECAFLDYCAVDAWAGLQVFLGARDEMRAKGIPFSSYRDRMVTGEICQAMQDQGVRLDLPYVELFTSRLEWTKAQFAVSGFNPRSPKQVQAFFKEHGIDLDGTEKEDIHQALDRACRKAKVSLKELDSIIFDSHNGHTLFELLGSRNLEESSFRKTVQESVLGRYHEALQNIPEEVTQLHLLYVQKGLGKGVKPWADEKYLRGEFVHPRFIDTGTMTTRLASAKPNFTNIPARGWGKAVKRMVIPRDESLDIVSSDRSQLELRNCLWLSGVDPSEAGTDAFTWLQQKAPEFDQAAAERQKGESGRDLAKITSHLSDYLGGIKILRPRDLDDPRIQKEIKYGSLRVYLKKYGSPWDWEVKTGIVAFSGVILAENLFGNKTQENRRRSLILQEDIFYKAFPMIREWQKKVTEEIDIHGCVRSPDGRMVELYDTPEENYKKGAAWLGQGVGAAFMTGLLRRYWLELGIIPLLMVHDDIVLEVPREWSDRKVANLCSLMDEEVPCLPGFRCPGKTKRGPNWGDCRPLQL